MKKVRLGIIGLGSHGSGHTRNILNGLSPELELTAVCDIDPDRLAAHKETFGEFPGFIHSEDLIRSGLVEAVLIATPHYFHPPISVDAMNNGIHVMCEKPAGVYTKQVREMNEVASRSNVVFGMMFNQRTDSVYIKTRELVKSGEFGEIRRVNWIITSGYRPQAYYDSGAWRATWSGEGGGVLLNQAPHNLDLWQWICGMPSKVYTKMKFGKWHDIEVEDDVTTIVEYPNGATGTFVTSTGEWPGSNRLEITMDKAKIVVENGKIHLWELEMTEQEFTATNTVPFAQPKYTYREVEHGNTGTGHSGILNAWAGAILRGEPLIANGEEGINGLTISNAMHLSAWTGREVELPFDDEEFYQLLMERVKTSRRKENVTNVIADLSGTYNTSYEKK